MAKKQAKTPNCTPDQQTAINGFLEHFYNKCREEADKIKVAIKKFRAGKELQGQFQYWDTGAKILDWLITTNRSRKATKGVKARGKHTSTKRTKRRGR